MQINYLKYFIVLAEELNFRKASQRLFISEQTLSACIKNLEKELNVTLFERRPRTRLTLAGESLLQHSKEILQINKHLFAELAVLSEHATYTLQIGANQIVASSYVPYIWQCFTSKFPNVRLSVTEDSTQRLDELLRKGQIDLYIGINASNRNDTIKIDLMNEFLCCIYSDAFLKNASQQQKEALKDPSGYFDLLNIEHFPLITQSPVNHIRQTLENFFIKYSLHPNIIFESNKHSTLYRFCSIGTGISILYPMGLYNKNIVNFENLHVLPLRNKLPPSKISLVYRKEAYLSQPILSFIQCAKNILSKL